MEPQSKTMFAVKGCLQVYRCFFKSKELLEEIFCFRTIKRSFTDFVSEPSRDPSQLLFQKHQEIFHSLCFKTIKRIFHQVDSKWRPYTRFSFTWNANLFYKDYPSCCAKVARGCATFCNAAPPCLASSWNIPIHFWKDCGEIAGSVYPAPPSLASSWNISSHFWKGCGEIAGSGYPAPPSLASSWNISSHFWKVCGEIAGSGYPAPPSLASSWNISSHFWKGCEEIVKQDQGTHLRESWQRSSSADEIFLDSRVDDSRQVLTKC
jgi:hypothetical protein